MKAIGLAAVAALVAASRMAGAHATDGKAPSAPSEAARAADEARGLVARMQSNAGRALDAHREARNKRVIGALACTNEALARADVALRYGRDDATRVWLAWSAGDASLARAALATLRVRAAASQEAVVRASRCVLPEVVVHEEGTRVTLWIDPTLPLIEPDFPR
jgi:hypothetical protein